MDKMLLIFGLGYSGRAIALAAQQAGWRVTASFRRADTPMPPGIAGIPCAEAAPAIAAATHVLTTVPPGDAGDPILAQYTAEIRTASRLRWVGYLSTTGIYGDHGGNWVDEATDPHPHADRSVRRLLAEQAWQKVGDRRAVDIFRLAGIYGPQNSVFDDLRAGKSRRVIKPGHAFGRIHRDDIAGAVLAALAQDPPPGQRIFNLADDEPAESATVITAAARLLGIAPPPEIPFAEAWASMRPMARSFWADNRKVSSRRTQEILHYGWRYPSYREGLAAILAEEAANHAT